MSNERSKNGNGNVHKTNASSVVIPPDFVPKVKQLLGAGYELNLKMKGDSVVVFIVSRHIV